LDEKDMMSDESEEQDQNKTLGSEIPVQVKWAFSLFGKFRL
jgi:hypothetical protein